MIEVLLCSSNYFDCSQPNQTCTLSAPEKEEFWREVIRRVDQQKKIDALYGRGSRDD